MPRLPLLKDISLTWFRNFQQQSFTFDAPVVGISGPNGIGKTNLLDAVYYLCYTKSYFQNKESNNVNDQHDGFRLEGHWDNDLSGMKEQTLCLFKEGKKSFLQDDIPYERISDHIGKYHAVMIAPDDMRIINNGSDQRRKFVDGLLAQTNSDYLRHLLNYQKILHQRNAYLKQTMPSHFQWKLIDVYDEQLAMHGHFLLQKRQALSQFLPAQISQDYLKLSDNQQEQIMLEYQPCCSPDNLLELFRKNHPHDIELKRTVQGPHTEDWYFSLNGNALKTHASQGQKKSFLIALKLAQLTWLQQFDKSPLLLMDDIFERLDSKRIQRLFQLLPKFNLKQMFITHTEAAEMGKSLQHYGDRYQMIVL